MLSSSLFVINSQLVRYLNNHGQDSKILAYQGLLFSIPILAIPAFKMGGVPTMGQMLNVLYAGVIFFVATVIYNYNLYYVRVVISAPFGLFRAVSAGLLAPIFFGRNLL